MNYNMCYHYVHILNELLLHSKSNNGKRPLSRCYHNKMTLESLLNQFKSENSFSSGRKCLTNSYISVELVKACVVLDMFKTFIRSGKSVVQLLKIKVFYYYNTRV